VATARKHLPPDAQIIIEPGRSLVAPFGVTLYRVVSVKGDDPRFVAVNGGMADNMEVALYGQRFEATVASRVGGGGHVDLVGRHCESGDRLITGVPLRDPRPGDLVAVAATGAYCYSLASNYNGAMRPPVVFCDDGETRLVVRRETIADFLQRDVTEALSAGSWSGTGGQPGPVVLLGDHIIEPGLQVAPRRRHGVHPVAGRDSEFQLAALVAQLGRGERVQGMFRLFDGWRVGGHGAGPNGIWRESQRDCACPATHVPRPGLPFEGIR
jgi:hypothetical protein